MGSDYDIVNIIQLNNGERKYGLLLKRDSVAENPHWEFVPFDRLKSYFSSKNRELIEQVPISMIKYVDRVHV